MNKRHALMVLVQHTFLLDEKVKRELLSHLDELSPEEIDAIGSFLAIEKKLSLEDAAQTTHAIQQSIHTLEEETNKATQN